MKDLGISNIKKGIQDEMKEKVKQKSYTVHGNQYKNQYRQYGQPRYNQYGVQVSGSAQSQQAGVTSQQNAGKKNTDVKKNSSRADKVDRPDYYKQENCIRTDDEVYDYFYHAELVEMGQVEDFEVMKELVEDYGYYNWFTDDDIETIMRVAIKELYLTGEYYTGWGGY